MPSRTGTPRPTPQRPLLSLPGRRALLDRLTAALTTAIRESFHLVFVDIDRFRVISQGLGTERSDEALIEVATRLRVRTREQDVYWLGADRFALWIVRPEAPQAWAASLVHDLGFVDIAAGRGLPLIASAGVLTVKPSDSWAADDVTARAEIALGHAKSHGGGAVVVFDPDTHGRDLLQQELRFELVRAIERGDLCMYYQPILRLADGALSGFEALLRWKHPQRGMISPGLFVPVLERDGMIHLLGEWIFERVGRELAELVSLGQPWHPLMTINVSRQQLRAHRFAERALETLGSAGVQPQHVGFEVTETSAIEDLDMARSQLAVWRAAGCRVLIDDFGVGSSSLASLHDFPVDLLKIDRVFVQGSVVSRRRRALTHAIADVGHSLGLSLVAEGIETKAELDAVMQLGCDYGQGYGLGRPASFEATAELLRSGRRAWPAGGPS